MNTIRTVFASLLVIGCGSMMATDVFLLNKTGKPLYYKVGYHTPGQDVLSIPALGAQDPKMMDWFAKQLEPKVGEGTLAPNASAQIMSYRVKYLIISDTKKEGLVKGQIVSFGGDKRILDLCQHRKQSDCIGSTLKDIKPSIALGLDSNTLRDISLGYIKFKQVGLTNLAVPLVLVITLDPALEKAGQIGYIVTELAHTWDLFTRRTPKAFFYELQKMPFPATK